MEDYKIDDVTQMVNKLAQEILIAIGPIIEGKDNSLFIKALDRLIHLSHQIQEETWATK